MVSIFINYRRYDEAYAAALLDLLLSNHLGPDQVFLAGRSILAGQDFEQAIAAAVEKSDLMLVIVGPHWTGSFDGRSNDDWVLREISTALKQSIPVIPVLLAGTERLQEQDLKPEISRIARSQYLRFDYRNSNQDAANIVRHIEQLLAAREQHQ